MIRVNLTHEVCKLLNIIPNELFKIRFCDGYEESKNLYYIDDRCTLCIKTDSNRIAPAEGLSVSDLISGYIEIIKLPWHPKFNEDYWTVDIYEDTHNLFVKQTRWTNLISDYAALKSGWCYKTKEEASDAMDKVKEELYELGLN